MFVGYDLFGFKDGSVFATRLAHPNYNELQITGTMVDDVYIDENIEIPFTINKPDSWMYSTVMIAKLQGNLEAGSIESGGFVTEKIRFQKRKWNELEWTNVGELEYRKDEKILYELIDKFVANDNIYQYSLLPVTSTVLGNRVLSDELTVDFEGIFLSDKNNNYRLLYDLEFGNINHNTPNSRFEPLNAQYPIVTYSNLDYTDFDIQATFISAHTINTQNERQVNIRMEKVDRENLLRFVKNRKPKIYRDINGNLKLVTIVDNPQEMPMSNISGISKLSLKMVEIGSVDSETLQSYGMLEGLEGVF